MVSAYTSELRSTWCSKGVQRLAWTNRRAADCKRHLGTYGSLKTKSASPRLLGNDILQTPTSLETAIQAPTSTLPSPQRPIDLAPCRQH